MENTQLQTAFFWRRSWRPRWWALGTRISKAVKTPMRQRQRPPNLPK